jgi:hypothetical protein
MVNLFLKSLMVGGSLAEHHDFGVRARVGALRHDRHCVREGRVRVPGVVGE